MIFYNTNPYRILGILANATAPEKQKVKAKIAAYLKVGKTPMLEFDICPPLNPIARTQDLLDLKSNELLHDQDKVTHALFWFISGGTIDNIALSNLTQSRNIPKALLNFEKGCKGGTVTLNSICSIVNHSTLEIMCYPQYRDRERLRIAINRKLQIASSNDFLNMLITHINADNREIDFAKIKVDVIMYCKKILKELFFDQNQDEIFLEFFSSQKEIIQEIQEKKNKILIDSIRNYLEFAKSQRELILNKEFGKTLLIRSYEIGLDMIDRCVPLLDQIKTNYGVDHIQTQRIYEEVFAQINLFSVLTINKFIKQYNEAHDGVSFVKSSGKTCYSHAIRLLEVSKRKSSGVSFPSKHTIAKNIEALKSQSNQWENIYEDIKLSEERQRINEIERQQREQRQREREIAERNRQERERKKREEKEKLEQEKKKKMEKLYNNLFVLIPFLSAFFCAILYGHIGGLIGGVVLGFVLNAILAYIFDANY